MLTLKTDKEKAADAALNKFLKDNKIKKDLVERLDKDLYVARNQIDVFSDKIGELAQKELQKQMKYYRDPQALKPKQMQQHQKKKQRDY